MGIEAIRGHLDARRLRHLIPRLQQYEELAKPIREALRPYYEKYISEMSTPWMAIGFDTAVFLTVLCQIFRPQRILDLGSGFSSFVFRIYAVKASPAPSVVSVDDEPTWLDTTRRFLVTNHLTSENLVDWQTFRSTKHTPFDFILHDLGRMPLRRSALRTVLALVRVGGFVVLDDIHKDEYRVYAKRVLAELNLHSYSLRAFTKDRYGRYTLLVMAGNTLNKALL